MRDFKWPCLMSSFTIDLVARVCGCRWIALIGMFEVVGALLPYL